LFSKKRIKREHAFPLLLAPQSTRAHVPPIPLPSSMTRGPRRCPGLHVIGTPHRACRLPEAPPSGWREERQVGWTGHPAHLIPRIIFRPFF
jgi:hypothetical protein